MFCSCSLVIGPCIPWISGMTLSAIVRMLRVIPDRFIASLVAVASQVPTRRCFLVTVVYSASRSEEHTSELQSRGHLVCRLLLEKKKNKGGSRRYQVRASR